MRLIYEPMNVFEASLHNVNGTQEEEENGADQSIDRQRSHE